MRNKNHIKKVASWYRGESNKDYLSRHPEFETFGMPKTFYFRILPYCREIHWAIIKTKGSSIFAYFINSWGRVFDVVEFKTVKSAQRRLRSCGFSFSTNRYCPFTPPEPIYIKPSPDKTYTPYSKGELLKPVQRDEKRQRKIEKRFYKKRIKEYEKWQNNKELNRLQSLKEEKTTLLEQIKKSTFFFYLLLCALLALVLYVL